VICLNKKDFPNPLNSKLKRIVLQRNGMLGEIAKPLNLLNFTRILSFNSFAMWKATFPVNTYEIFGLKTIFSFVF